MGLLTGPDKPGVMAQAVMDSTGMSYSDYMKLDSKAKKTAYGRTPKRKAYTKANQAKVKRLGPRTTSGSLWEGITGNVDGPTGSGERMTKLQRFGRYRSDYAINVMQESGISWKDYAKLSNVERQKIYQRTPTGVAKKKLWSKTPRGKAWTRAYQQSPSGKAAARKQWTKGYPARAKRTPPWADNKKINKIYSDIAKSGKSVDHGLPLQGKKVSGLDVPDNLMGMGLKENVTKGNRLPDDFLDWDWKHNPKTGRLDAFRRVGGKMAKAGGKSVRVPRAQGGFINAGLLKNIGKVGLLGAGEAALNYFVPDNPINQARERGNGLLSDIGLDLQGGIEGIQNPMLRGSAHLANGMFADPFVTALGAGANMGDRIYKEWTGENIRPNITKQGPAMQGRFNNG